MRAILHIDGASRGNPGPAAIGVVIADEDGTVLAQVSEYIGQATNNVAEYKALLRGLKEAERLGVESLLIYGDSQLMIRQMNREYRVRHPGLLPLYNQAQDLVRVFRDVSFVHVPREKNASADELANRALDKMARKETPLTKEALCKGTGMKVTKMSPEIMDTSSEEPKSQRLLSVPQVLLIQAVINPGSELSCHKSDTDTFFHVLSGNGCMVVLEEEIYMKAGETVFVPRHAHHMIKVAGEKPLKVLVGRIPNPEGEEHESVNSD